MHIDFHSHIYPCYELNSTINSLVKDKAELQKVAFLTERSDCNFFGSLQNYCIAKLDLSAEYVQPNLVKINNNLNIFKARQFASSDGIEILSIFAAPELNDKKDSADYCSAIIEAGGLIAFSWAFGKWFGSRSQKIYDLCHKYGKANVIILDSRLRPELLPLPSTIIKLKQEGFKLLAGSDPLPLKSHQNKILSFGNIFPDSLDPLEQRIRSHIFNNSEFETFGSHAGLFEFAKDQLSLRLPLQNL